MENKGAIKRLVGETAIYGLSTIVARFVNYMFLPLYTYILTTDDYGALTEFMAYVAILQVLLTMGLETGCFRFANKEGYEPAKVFSGALVSVAILSGAFILLMALFGERLSVSMGYRGYGSCYIYIALILFSDSVTSILFAKLRYQGRAWRFALFKSIKIFTETLSNVVLFLLFPLYAASHPDTVLLKFISSTPDFSYPIFSMLVSAIVAMLLFVPELVRTLCGVERRTVKSLLLYSLPLMVAGLPGVMNDFLDRILFRFFNVDDTLWRADLGVYQAAVKVAVIMSLFVQMFRFASEPFFFARAKDKDVKSLYAGIMDYFVGFCMLIFLGVVFYLDIIQLIVGKDFRVGMDIVPVMLLSYLLLGMLFNVSMWYKLSDRSSFAIYITIAGLVVTACVNILFMPKYSYHAAAWGHFLSYLVMLVISVLLGRKYYRIPYRWSKVLMIIFFALALYGISGLIPREWPAGWVYTVKTLFIIIYIGGFILMEGLLPKLLKRDESKNRQ